MATTVNPITPKKYVVELRYEAKLSFYPAMDPMGEELAREFPGWERSPLTLELRSPKEHRRLFLSHLRTFFEQDAIRDLDQVEDRAKTYLEKVARHFSFNDFQRIGNRYWFIHSVDKTFPALTETLFDKLFSANNSFRGLFPGIKSDIGYVAYFEHPDGWKYNVRIGPMRRSEWFEKVIHEPDIFNSIDVQDGLTLDAYRQSFPEQFIYFDIDCYKQQVTKDDVAALLSGWRRFATTAAGALFAYCGE